MEDLKRRPEENYYQYLWRIGTLVDSGALPSWSVITPAVNAELETDEKNYKNEATYRKKYQSARLFKEQVFDQPVGDPVISKLWDIQKEKVKMRDYNRDYAKNNRLEARLEERIDLLRDELSRIADEKYPESSLRENHKVRFHQDNNDMLVILSDWHIGQSYCNIAGEFGQNSVYYMLEEYVDAVVWYSKMFDCENCYVILVGDLINGYIHSTLSMEDTTDAITQTMKAGRLVEYIINRLVLECDYNQIFVHSVSGNHSRLKPKDLSLRSERLDRLIPWYLEGVFKNYRKKVVFRQSADPSLETFNIRGKEYVAVHGDFDGFDKTGSNDLSAFLGYFPYAIIYGHKHKSSFASPSRSKLIMGGSLSGAGSNHSIEHRFVGEPSQMFCVLHEGELELLKPVYFKDNED
jgi:hypothetical protein